MTRLELQFQRFRSSLDAVERHSRNSDCTSISCAVYNIEHEYNELKAAAKDRLPEIESLIFNVLKANSIGPLKEKTAGMVPTCTTIVENLSILLDALQDFRLAYHAAEPEFDKKLFSQGSISTLQGKLQDLNVAQKKFFLAWRGSGAAICRMMRERVQFIEDEKASVEGRKIESRERERHRDFTVFDYHRSGSVAYLEHLEYSQKSKGNLKKGAEEVKQTAAEDLGAGHAEAAQVQGLGLYKAPQNKEASSMEEKILETRSESPQPRERKESFDEEERKHRRRRDNRKEKRREKSSISSKWRRRDKAPRNEEASSFKKQLQEMRSESPQPREREESSDREERTNRRQQDDRKDKRHDKSASSKHRRRDKAPQNEEASSMQKKLREMRSESLQPREREESSDREERTNRRQQDDKKEKRGEKSSVSSKQRRHKAPRNEEASSVQKQLPETRSESPEPRKREESSDEEERQKRRRRDDREEKCREKSFKDRRRSKERHEKRRDRRSSKEKQRRAYDSDSD